MNDERLSYMKGVEADCSVCRYWRHLDFCAFPGKLKIKNGVCFGMTAKGSDSP